MFNSSSRLSGFPGGSRTRPFFLTLAEINLSIRNGLAVFFWLVACAPSGIAFAAPDPDKTTIVIGATAGPYADQIKVGIKDILEKQGYRVKVVEFHDYVQPNLALAQGALDANVFQNRVYLKRFAEDHALDLAVVAPVPTVPMALYSRRHKSLDEVKPGATVALPNDPTNQARALAILSRIGWITLKPGADPLRVSERDIAQNLKQIKLFPLEAAHLPTLAGRHRLFVHQWQLRDCLGPEAPGCREDRGRHRHLHDLRHGSRRGQGAAIRARPGGGLSVPAVLPRDRPALPRLHKTEALGPRHEAREFKQENLVPGASRLER